MRSEIEWPYGEKTFSGKWWKAVFVWFCGPRLLVVLFLLAVIEQAGDLW